MDRKSTGRPTELINLDTQGLSETEPPTKEYFFMGCATAFSLSSNIRAVTSLLLDRNREGELELEEKEGSGAGGGGHHDGDRQ